jgi:arylsulfatase A-like enzyme
MSSNINRREFLTHMGAAAVGLSALNFSALSAGCQSVGAARRRPNILFIMSDDHAAHAIGAYGSRINKTPHMDRLAKEGARLESCFCTNAICTPSRAAIMTGQYGHINGVRGWENIDSRRPIQTQKLLQAAGYTTAMVGKWHLGRGGNSNPQGFDYWDILEGQGAYIDPVFYTAQGQRKITGYATDITTDIALNWLKGGRDKEKPFYLCVHHKAPHRNWIPAEKYKQLYAQEKLRQPDTLKDDYAGRPAAEIAHMRLLGNFTLTDTKGAKPPAGLSDDELIDWYYQLYMKDYVRCVQSVDDSVGQLLDYLDQSGLAQDTIIAYTSDQGFFLGDHGWFDKRFMYEESLKMPFLIRYPREIKPGTVTNKFLTNVDFAPTFLDYADVAVPPEIQGTSGRAMLSGKAPRDWQESMYYRYWVNGDEHNNMAHYGVRTPTHKLIYFYGRPLGTVGANETRPPLEPFWELYDLKKDPHELKNVYNDPKNARLFATLKTELNRLQKKFNDQPQHIA